MYYLGRFKFRVTPLYRPLVRGVLALGAILVLVSAIACGAAAPPAPKSPEAAKPAAPAAPAVAPAPKAAVVPTPAPTPAPVVHPGKVTLMVTYFGAERFDAVFSAAGKEYHKAFHGFLVSWDKSDGRMTISPGIASKWEISNDGKTTTYTIRKGVKFHDGKELTAEDVLWSAQHFMGPQAREYSKNSVSISYSKIMDRIEQTGPDQVSVTTKVPSPELSVYMSENEGGASGSVVMPRRSKLGDREEGAAYDKNPIGAGLVKFVSHVPQASMTFERFADFYYQPKNGLPTDKRLNFRVLELKLIPEEATRVAALRAGEADVALVSLGTRKQVEAGGGRLVFGPEAAAMETSLYGCWKPEFPCRDKRVRQALSYAFDKELMRDKLYGGPEVMQVKGWWVVTPTTIGYSPELDPYPFDPNKARQLLAEAGYPGGTGFGKLIVNTAEELVAPLVPEAAQLAADMWKRELGLDVEVKLWDKVKIGQTITLNLEELYGQIVWRANNTRLDARGIVRLRYFTPYKDGPAMRLHNDPELLALLGPALAVSAPAEMERTLNSTYRRLREEAHVIPIGYVNAPWGVGPRIAKWEPYPVAEYASALHTIVLK